MVLPIDAALALHVCTGRYGEAASGRKSAMAVVAPPRTAWPARGVPAGGNSVRFPGGWRPGTWRHLPSRDPGDQLAVWLIDFACSAGTGSVTLPSFTLWMVEIGTKRCSPPEAGSAFVSLIWVPFDLGALQLVDGTDVLAVGTHDLHVFGYGAGGNHCGVSVCMAADLRQRLGNASGSPSNAPPAT